MSGWGSTKTLVRGPGTSKFTFVSVSGWRVIDFCRARMLDEPCEGVGDVNRQICCLLVLIEILHLCMRSMPMRASTCRLFMNVMGWVIWVSAITTGRE